MKLPRLLAAAVTGMLATHIALTILENSPDGGTHDLSKFNGGLPIPKWRFFAPNPGVHNVHLLVRERDHEGIVGDWRDVTPRVSHPLLGALWNPGSRGPKALFDAMQQLVLMQGANARFEWVRSSDSYDVIRAVARKSAKLDAEAVQFMIVNVEPAAVDEEPKLLPVVVSLFEERAGKLA